MTPAQIPEPVHIHLSNVPENKKLKATILNEFFSSTGYSRMYAIRLLLA